MSEIPHVLDEYAQRLRSDLEANEQEQKRLLSALHQLEREYEVLLKMRITLDAGAKAVARLLEPPAALTGSPLSERGVGLAQQSHLTPVDTHLLAGRSRGRRPGERSLIEVVCALLREQEEPRSVAEIRKAVMKQRPATEQTVRNTLDRLVSTGKAERTTQGRSVFYSATRHPTGTPGTWDGIEVSAGPAE
ncbi:BlaI/MecI/CopY family transcriptional regulator [Streptomyces sp. NPDC007084]|uniref:BlaI/MecI/CopY family transcriptional regulator n=1 Tax=Streptomyces sp. NPDC007084 TaxID=3154313 RepID=UPI00345327B1